MKAAGPAWLSDAQGTFKTFRYLGLGPEQPASLGLAGTPLPPRLCIKFCR